MATLVRTFAPNFPALFENYLGREFQHQSLPAVNVIENEDGFKLALAAPGLKKEDFNVSFVENTLTISAEKEVKVDENSTEKFTRQEFSYTSFKRSFTLPKTVDGEKISATYEDGILLLALPKKEEAKPKEPRAIEIA